jgi:3-phosphoshikimate 1-carboxyvinyltransferase
MIISCKNLMLDLKAPPSKSAYHRELIVNFILGARGDFLSIRNDDNDDVTATKRCLAALASASETGEDDIILPANESGSTLRFLIPTALALKGSPERKMVFTTKGRLIERPVDDLADCLEPFGVTIEKDIEKSTVTAKGFLMAGEYTIDGSVSSQYISGLLMALSNFNRPSKITVTGEMSSIHYIELTVAVLKKYGIEVTREGNVFSVPGRSGAVVPDGRFSVEGDWSNGAFLLCLGSLMKNGGAMITGLDTESVQGDRAITDFLEKLGVEVDTEDGAVSVMGPDGEPPVDEVNVSCNDIPDIVPYMAVTGAFKAKKTVLTGTKRLRVKESDRATAICEMLSACGIKTELEEDSITVFGAVRSDIPEEISLTSSNDHRMAMAAVLCAAGTGRKVAIDDISCLSKSFPEFKKIIENGMAIL